MKLTKEDVLRTAELANLKIDDKDINSSRADMQEFLIFCEQLDEVDVSNTLPTVVSIPFENILRDDVITTSLKKEDVLSNAPKSNVDGFIVPKVLE